jgi:hypothetical protein
MSSVEGGDNTMSSSRTTRRARLSDGAFRSTGRSAMRRGFGAAPRARAAAADFFGAAAFFGAETLFEAAAFFVVAVFFAGARRIGAREAVVGLRLAPGFAGAAFLEAGFPALLFAEVFLPADARLTALRALGAEALAEVDGLFRAARFAFLDAFGALRLAMVGLR